MARLIVFVAVFGDASCALIERPPNAFAGQTNSPAKFIRSNARVGLPQQTEYSAARTPIGKSKNAGFNFSDENF